jgi:hypothetical protein
MFLSRAGLRSGPGLARRALSSSAGGAAAASVGRGAGEGGGDGAGGRGGEWRSDRGGPRGGGGFRGRGGGRGGFSQGEGRVVLPPSDPTRMEAEDAGDQELGTRNLFGKPRGRRPYKDPVSGVWEGGRLNICFTKNYNSALVPLDMRDEIYQLHKTDPEGKGSLLSLALKTGLRVRKIQGIIKIREHELAYERDVLKGEKLDQSLDMLARQWFGQTRQWNDVDGDFQEREQNLSNFRKVFTGLMPSEPDPPPPKLKADDKGPEFYKRWRLPVPFRGETITKQDKQVMYFALPEGADKEKKAKRGGKAKASFPLVQEK